MKYKINESAEINVIHPILVEGIWLPPGKHTVWASYAIEHKDTGLYEILSIDGQPYIATPCCANH